MEASLMMSTYGSLARVSNSSWFSVFKRRSRFRRTFHRVTTKEITKIYICFIYLLCETCPTFQISWRFDIANISKSRRRTPALMNDLPVARPHQSLLKNICISKYLLALDIDLYSLTIGRKEFLSPGTIIAFLER